MSGVEESDYDLLSNRIDLLDDIELVYHGQYKEALRIRQLPGLNETVWEYYKLHALNLKEIELFTIALTKLRQAITEVIRNARKSKTTKEGS